MGYACFRDAMAFDGLANWEAKARHAFLAGGFLPSSYFSDASRAGYHLRYPLYLPFTELWVYLWAGDCDQAQVKILFPIFYGAGLLILWSAMVRLTGRVWSATITSLLPIFLPSIADHGFGLAQGYPEFPLATLYLASLAGLMAWRLKGFEVGWVLAIICAALIPWVKQDGLILLASLFVVAAMIHGWSNWRRYVIFMVPGLVVIGAWSLALRCVHAVSEPDFQALTLGNFVQNLPRLRPVVCGLLERLGTVGNWSVLWYCVPVALACVFRWERRVALWLGAALLLPLALDIPPYLFTNLELQFHLSTSQNRLIVEISLVAVLVMGLALDGHGLSERSTASAVPPVPGKSTRGKRLGRMLGLWQG
jgi:hypothetical protein